jgi:hypothetical protein
MGAQGPSKRLGHHKLQALTDNAVQVVSEFVTNAIEPGTGHSVNLALLQAGRTLHIDVAGQSDGTPGLVTAPVEAASRTCAHHMTRDRGVPDRFPAPTRPDGRVPELHRGRARREPGKRARTPRAWSTACCTRARAAAAAIGPGCARSSKSPWPPLTSPPWCT